MNKRALVILTIATFLTTPLTTYALLPPLYHTIGEIQGMLGELKKENILQSSEAIISIVKINDGYLITTTRNTLQVTVSPLPNGHIGPATFKYQFKEPEPLARTEGESHADRVSKTN